MIIREGTDAVESGMVCPAPMLDEGHVLLAHGSGGTLTHRLIKQVLLPRFRNELLEPLHDGAVFFAAGRRFAFSTDSYVIDPIFFPGGDIGSLAVNGTVNDLAMCGADPLYLSAALIVEEGFPMAQLERIVESMERAAREAGVRIVTGDTKVVDRGKVDKIFINTSGIGLVDYGAEIDPRKARPGDKIILSGTMAEHGMAIMSVREGLEFDTELRSDTAPLNNLVAQMLRTSREIHVLRDPTRGGVATALNEIAESARLGIEIREESLPLSEPVQGACEILGFDPLYVANEGKLLAVVEAEHAEDVLRTMRRHPMGRDAAIIGEVVADHGGVVLMRTTIGSSRIVDMLSGEQLPRIC